MKDSWIAPVLRVAYFIVGANLFATWNISDTPVANIPRLLPTAKRTTFAPTFPIPFPDVDDIP